MNKKALLSNLSELGRGKKGKGMAAEEVVLR